MPVSKSNETIRRYSAKIDKLKSELAVADSKEKEYLSILKDKYHLTDSKEVAARLKEIDSELKVVKLRKSRASTKIQSLLESL